MNALLVRVLAVLLLLAQVWVGCARGAAMCVSIGAGERCGDSGQRDSDRHSCHSSRATSDEHSPVVESACCDSHEHETPRGADADRDALPRPDHAHDHAHHAAITLALDHDPCCCCVHLAGGVPDLTSSIVERNDRGGDRLSAAPTPDLLLSLADMPPRATSLEVLVAPRHPPPDRGRLAESRAIRVTCLLL